jgi:putative peptidoglycan lipid II flippase
MDRIAFYVAPTIALYIGAGDVIVGALLERGAFSAADTRLVWFTVAAFALGLLGTTRSRLLQNGLYALNRPRIVARVAVLRVTLAAAIGALLMFPFDRYAISGSDLERADGWLGPLPDSLRLAGDGLPRLGVVGLALGAAASSWVEYRVLRSALEWRVGHLPRSSDTRWAVLAAVGAGVLAAGLRAVTGGLAPLVSAAVVVPVSLGAYLATTSAFRVDEAASLVTRIRGMRTRLGG